MLIKAIIVLLSPCILRALTYDDFFIKNQLKPLSEIKALIAGIDTVTLNKVLEEKFILYKGTKYPSPTNGSSLLFPAINLNVTFANSIDNIQQHLQLVSLLLSHGLSPNIQNQKNETALTKLVEGNFSSNDYGNYSVDVLTLLLAHGATIDLNTGSIPLYLRAQQISRDDPKTASIILGDPPLMAALRAEDLDAVEILIKNPQNSILPNNNNDTPLHLILSLSYINSANFYLIPLLIANGADLNAQNNQGETPLSYFASIILSTRAGSVSNVKQLQALLQAGASLDIKNAKGQSPRDILLKKYKSYTPPLQQVLQAQGIAPVDPMMLYHLAEALQELAA